MLSLIQGLALALLATQASAFLDNPTEASSLSWAQMASCLVTIVTTYYMYIWFVLVARWPPTILDTLIPFVLGLGEAVLISQFESGGRRWLAAQAIMLFVGCLAFAHSIWRLKSDMFTKPGAYRLVHNLLTTLAAGMTVGCLASAFSAMWWPQAATVVTFALCAGVSTLVALSERAIGRLFVLHGLRYVRPLPNGGARLTHAPTRGVVPMRTGTFRGATQREP